MEQCETIPAAFAKVATAATTAAERYRRGEVDKEFVHDARVKACEGIFQACSRFKCSDIIFDYSPNGPSSRRRLGCVKLPPELILHGGPDGKISFGLNGNSAQTTSQITDDLRLLDDTPAILRQIGEMSSS